MQSVPITTKVVGSNPVPREVYSIQHYVMKFVSDLFVRFIRNNFNQDVHTLGVTKIAVNPYVNKQFIYVGN